MKSLKVLFLLILLAFSAPFGFAQMVVSPLSSPVLAGAGGGTASQESPFADRMNPAASAGKQRVTLDASYFGLVGVGESGYGNAFNLGLTVPARWGVVTGGLSYWGGPLGTSGDFKNFKLGHQGQLTLGLSKDLWEDFYIGTNVNTAFGTGGWGVGASFGFLQFIGDWGWLKDVRWGGALRDLGTAYTTTSGFSVPPVFTPAVGAEFDAWRDDKLKFTLRPDFSFPSFQDINMNLGSTALFGDFIAVNFALRFDLRDTLAGTAATMPFSFGVGFHFFTDLAPQDDVFGLKEKGWNRSEVRINSAALPLTGGVWALGAGANIPLGVKDATPPAVAVDAKVNFISPNNDGAQDSLVLPISITDERYITGYTLQVVDKDKATVRTLQSRITLPESQGWDQIWNRLTYVKHGIDVPKALEWNGNTEAGTVAPDGTYSLVVTAWDDNGNKKDWPAGTVVVKNTPPTVAVSAPITEFNPVGPRDKLNLVQRGSAEALWTGTFLDNRDQVVLTKTWKNGSPDSFDWDGKGADGKLVPDGVYSYAVTATDAAGNKTTAKVGNLIVNSIPTPLDLKLSRTAFSPGGNGAKTVTFQPKVGVTTGLTGWKLEVQDKKGTAYRTLSGAGVVPSDLAFNGKDEGGNVLSEGEYRAKLTLTYSNGNVPEVVSPPFTVKNTAPQATLTSPYQVFSPGSEEGRGVLVFDQKSTEEDVWTGKLTDGTGKVVRTVRWPGKADATYLWDGRGSDGNILPDGTYLYHLEAVDRAGNTGTSPVLAVTIDTAKRSVLLSSDRSAFTPVSTGTNNKVRFVPQLKESKGLQTWTLTVQDAAGQPVRTWSGTSVAPGPQDWDGKDEQGVVAPDGTYTALLKTTYGNGTAPAARSNALILKNTLPRVEVTADALLFSPTPDSARPVITLKQSSSVEAEWTGAITKGGEAVKTFTWKGEVHDVVWDGTDDTGNKVPDGTYRYEVKTTDVADNSVSKAVEALTVDTRPTPLFVTMSADGFSPNGDGVADSITINTRVGLNEGIQAWRLEVNNESQGLRKVFEGKGSVPAQFSWDGTTDRGTRTEDGKYSARLSVAYTKGNHPETRSSVFLVQAGPPQLALDLSPQPFSPDNDGVADELLINLGVRSVSPVANWSLDILDPEGHRFIVFSGKGAPSAQLKWDGRSGSGELVQSASDYTAVFTASDALGNSSTVKKPLAVDVLVMKDGDRLRIIIPSITFAPNSPDFLGGIDADKAAKNVSVLKRLAEIFTKYQRYKIGIEGHAVMINWADTAKGQKEQDSELLPLSQKRADAVKDYLVKLGIASARVRTEGLGGARPIVPFSDLDNRWKDRRVEFWLDRE
jgi:flagellar hook assembly protein FlgD/outer membrane protein OmpA-like peptidoglycan-associated protein